MSLTVTTTSEATQPLVLILTSRKERALRLIDQIEASGHFSDQASLLARIRTLLAQEETFPLALAHLFYRLLLPREVQEFQVEVSSLLEKAFPDQTTFHSFLKNYRQEWACHLVSTLVTDAETQQYLFGKLAHASLESDEDCESFSLTLSYLFFEHAEDEEMQNELRALLSTTLPQQEEVDAFLASYHQGSQAYERAQKMDACREKLLASAQEELKRLRQIYESATEAVMQRQIEVDIAPQARSIQSAAQRLRAHAQRLYET